MPKIEKIFLLLLLGLFIIVLFWDITEDSFFSRADTEEILDDIIPVQSINPENTDYSDLAFLKYILHGNRILLLGEPLHFDGSVFLAKTHLNNIYMNT
jgi:erythromycin esterase-like protein